jgi:transposase-like protein
MTAKRNEKPGTKRTRRIFSREFKQEAVQMLLDGHSAGSVAKNLGIDNTA